VTEINQQAVNNEAFLKSIRESSASKSPRAIFRQLTLQVSGTPNDLMLHTQRILLCIDNNLPEYLSGSVQDLFLTLKDTGYDLRLKMFNLISPHIEFNERSYLQKWLADGSDKNLECEQFKGSVFRSCHCKANMNEESVNSMTTLPKFDSIVDESRHYVESGKLLEAHDVLATRFSKAKRDSQVEQELLRFYYYSKNKNLLDKMLHQLDDSRWKIPKKWLKLQEISETWK